LMRSLDASTCDESEAELNYRIQLLTMRTPDTEYSIHAFKRSASVTNSTLRQQLFSA